MSKRKYLKALCMLAALTTGINAYASTKTTLANAQYPLYYDGESKYGEYALEVFSNLPDYVIDTLNNSGSSVIIVGDESGAEKAYKAYYKDKAPTGLIGLTISRILTTYVEGNPHEILYKRYPNLVKKYTKEVLDKKIIEFFLIHEVGHLMDIISYYKNSSNGGFEEIYKEEKENFKELEVYKSGGLSLEDNISTIPEYFASAFACYFIDGEEIKEKCPKTYQHIKKRLEKMKNKLIMSR